MKAAKAILPPSSPGVQLSRSPPAQSGAAGSSFQSLNASPAGASAKCQWLPALVGRRTSHCAALR